VKETGIHSLRAFVSIMVPLSYITAFFGKELGHLKDVNYLHLNLEFVCKI
jgi:hypothetical protein